MCFHVTFDTLKHHISTYYFHLELTAEKGLKDATVHWQGEWEPIDNTSVPGV